MQHKEMEQEANLFACLLLMPKEFIEQDLASGIDLGDDKEFKEMAKKYQVPLNALAYRISLYQNRGI